MMDVRGKMQRLFMPSEGGVAEYESGTRHGEKPNDAKQQLR